jgi:hypothetical protein
MSLNPTKLLLGIATPIVAAGSAWLAAAAAKYGIHLDASGINALGIAGATAGAAAMVKLIHDVEKDPKVAKVVHSIEAGAVPVVSAVEKADPGANNLVDDAIAQAQRAVQAQFNELVAQLPQPSPAPAPAAPAPAPVPPVAPTV